MSTPFNGRKGQVGFAKQSAEGSAASNPTYTLPFAKIGDLLKQDANEADFAASSLQPEAEFKEMLRVDGSVEVPAYQASIGLLALAVLGTDSVAGSSPYVHTLTFADTPPWLTLFWRVADEYFKGTDVRVDKLEIGFEAGKRINVMLDMKGKTGSRLTSSYTSADPAALNAFMPYRGATMKLDVDSTTTVQSRAINSGKLRFARELEVIQTDALTPQFVHPKRSLFECEFDAILEDWDIVRATFFGGTTGNDPSGTLVYGALDFTYTYDANFIIQAVANNISMRAGFPEPNVDGSAVKLKVVGRALKDGTATPKLVLSNTVASY